MVGGAHHLTELTSFVWPENLSVGCGERTSHMMMVLSDEQLASRSRSASVLMLIDDQHKDGGDGDDDVGDGGV